MKQVLIKWRRFVAILIGIVFLGSGLLKIEDPVGPRPVQARLWPWWA